MKSIILPAIFIFLTSCTGTTVPVDNTWEGIRGNTLRVAVFQFTADEENENKIKENIIEAGKERGALLLVSYASLSMDRTRVSTGSDEILNRAISESIKTGKIIYQEWRESGYTLAFVEFDISLINRTLKIINSRN